MTTKALIFRILEDSELCDDCLSEKSGITPRQSVNYQCRQLYRNSAIFRHRGKCDSCHKTKTINHLSTNSAEHVKCEDQEQSPNSPSNDLKPWFWERNIQGQVVKYLVQKNYTIRSVADTAARTSGKDIIAISTDNKELWVTVKGYPEKSSNTQARHWFSNALFDLILYYNENPNVRFGIALPAGFITYSNLLPRVKWFIDYLSISVFWVSKDGSIKEDKA